MTHDYKAALEAAEKCRNSGHLYALFVGHKDAIIHALKLADKVTGEPSDGVLLAGEAHTSKAWAKGFESDAESIFKAMIAQAQKEIE